MGMAAFNRARRSRLPVEKIETERFIKDNEARWARTRAQDDNNGQDEKDVERVRKAEAKAMQEIGQKAEEGIKMGEDGGIADLPLRQDHAAEIAGRSVEDAQGEPVSPLDRLAARVPEGTANEALVEHTQVDRPGPTPELVEAARLESIPQEEREEELRAQADSAEDRKTAAAKTAEKDDAKAKKEAELPAAGKSAGAGAEPASSTATAAKPTPKK